MRGLGHAALKLLTCKACAAALYCSLYLVQNHNAWWVCAIWQNYQAIHTIQMHVFFFKKIIIIVIVPGKLLHSTVHIWGAQGITFGRLPLHPRKRKGAGFSGSLAFRSPRAWLQWLPSHEPSVPKLACFPRSGSPCSCLPVCTDTAWGGGSSGAAPPAVLALAVAGGGCWR